jgi:hypothetical protein
MDCFVASAPRNDGSWSRFNYQTARRAHVRIVAARCARALRRLTPSKKQEGAGRPGARCTRGLVRMRNLKKAHTSIQVQRRTLRPSLRNGFTAYSVLSPVNGLFCHRRPRGLTHELDASIAAPGPHGFAVRIPRARQPQGPRPSHPTARFVTIAFRPSHRVRRAEL